MIRTDDLRIVQSQPLLTPAVLFDELPHGDAEAELVSASRRSIEAILRGADRRLLCIVGPCSVHDPAAALDYARQLRTRIDALADALFVVLRVYFEKPRTVVGWKGLINDPDLDGSFHINKGLRLARQLLLDVARAGLPAATEFLDTTFGQYYADLVSFGAIGARTVESQVHRELASGLSMPVGIKNRTDGDIAVAIDAIRAAAQSHWFPSLTKEGSPAILCSTGNEYCCLILRGGSASGPNHDAQSIARALSMLRAAALTEALIVDCSHGNSAKDPARQALVARDVAAQIAAGQRGIRGVMIESHLVGGAQPIGPRAQLRYGQSITDACLALEDTMPVLQELAAAVRAANPS
jgi:3-deoxy-7-phosphoheptulonate synthase